MKGMLNVSVTANLLENTITNSGENLNELSQKQAILLVFLRHLGCVFCKEAITDIIAKRATIENNGIRIVFVHMAKEEVAKPFFEKYEVEDLLRISDPAKKVYAAFGVTKGTPSQLYGLRNWMGGFNATFVKGHTPEYAPDRLGDATQMPGIFLLKEGKIKESYLHKYAADRPDYEQLIQCCVI